MVATYCTFHFERRGSRLYFFRWYGLVRYVVQQRILRCPSIKRVGRSRLQYLQLSPPCVHHQHAGTAVVRCLLQASTIASLTPLSTLLTALIFLSCACRGGFTAYGGSIIKLWRRDSRSYFIVLETNGDAGREYSIVVVDLLVDTSPTARSSLAEIRVPHRACYPAKLLQHRV